MRLIDADALLEAMEIVGKWGGYSDVIKIIINAPTVKREGWIEPTVGMVEAVSEYLISQGWEADSVYETDMYPLFEAILAALPADKE